MDLPYLKRTSIVSLMFIGSIIIICYHHGSSIEYSLLSLVILTDRGSWIVERVVFLTSLSKNILQRMLTFPFLNLILSALPPCWPLLFGHNNILILPTNQSDVRLSGPKSYCVPSLSGHCAESFR